MVTTLYYNEANHTRDTCLKTISIGKCVFRPLKPVSNHEIVVLSIVNIYYEF